jgi:CO/xanthine dehydrogenase Mo-binding subunit
VVINHVLLEGQILGGLMQGLGQVLGEGAGEAGTTGALPTMMNAVLDALRPAGVTHLEMPATAERVWHALARLA